MKTLLNLLVATFAIYANSVLAAPETPKEYKRVSFHDFFAGNLEPVPLSLEIPALYAHATGVETPDDSYSYWMLPEEVADSIKSGDLPSDTGYIYGKLSNDVGFDQKTGKFTSGGESEFQIEAEFKEQGMKVIEIKRFNIGSHPILSAIIQAENGVVMCVMYVPMLIETNVLFLAYAPPMKDLETGKTVWNHILGSLKQE